MNVSEFFAFVGSWITGHKFIVAVILYALLVCGFIMGGFHMLTVKPTKKIVEQDEHAQVQKDVKEGKPARLVVAILSVVLSVPLFGYFMYVLVQTAQGIGMGGSKSWVGMQIGATGFKMLFLVFAYLGFFVVPAWNFYHTGSKPMFMGGYSPVNESAKRLDQTGQVMLFGFFLCAIVAVGYMMAELKKKDMNIHAVQYSAEIAFMAVFIGLFASLASLFTIGDKHLAMSVAYSI